MPPNVLHPAIVTALTRSPGQLRTLAYLARALGSHRAGCLSYKDLARAFDVETEWLRHLVGLLAVDGYVARSTCWCEAFPVRHARISLTYDPLTGEPMPRPKPEKPARTPYALLLLNGVESSVVIKSCTVAGGLKPVEEIFYFLTDRAAAELADLPRLAAQFCRQLPEWMTTTIHPSKRDPALAGVPLLTVTLDRLDSHGRFHVERDGKVVNLDRELARISQSLAVRRTRRLRLAAQ
jgi:hypothetical protein